MSKQAPPLNKNLETDYRVLVFILYASSVTLQSVLNERGHVTTQCGDA
jgi:hypothetical protein